MSWVPASCIRIAVLLSLAASLAGCSGSDDDTESDGQQTLSQDTDFAFVERSISETAAAGLSLYQEKLENPNGAPQDLNSPYAVSPGAKLFHRSSLDVDAVQWSVLETYFGDRDYDVKDLNVSADGSRMIFAAHGGEGHGGEGHGGESHPGDNSWNIYEYEFDSRQLRRIIEDDLLANSGEDTNPSYADDGRIVFSSNRAAGNPNSPVDNVSDDKNDEDCYKIGPAEQPSLLHIMSSRGDNILQLTYGNNHDTKTTALSDGRIAFVRWSRSYQLLPQCSEAENPAGGAVDLEGPFSGGHSTGLAPPESWRQERLCSHTIATPLGRALPSNHYTLLTVDPDSEQLEQLYDTVTIFGSEEEFVFLDKIMQGRDGYLLGVMKHFYNQQLGGNLVTLRDPFSASVDTVFGNLSPRPLGSAEVDLYPDQLSADGWYSAAFPYQDGSSRLLVSWSQCSTRQDGVNTFCRQGESGQLNKEYGLWVYDAEADSRLPLIEPRSDVVYTDLAMARSKTGQGLPFAPVNAPFVDNLDESRLICDDPTDIPPNDPDDPVDPVDPSDPNDPVDPVNPDDPVDPDDPDDPDNPVDPVDPGDPGSQENRAPVARAGPDQNVAAGRSVSLDGSDSYDPDGDRIGYLWSFLEISPASELGDEDIVGRDTANPSFIPDEAVEFPIKADFVFIIDGSASMQGEIGAVRNGLRRFVENVTNPENGIDGRFAVVTFEERPLGSLLPVVQLAFTESTVEADVTDQVIAAFDAIDTSNIGPEQREAGLEAIRAVLGDPDTVSSPLDGLEFRPTARKNLILATDEDSDGPYNGGDFEPPDSLDDGSAEAQPWQDEIDRTAAQVIANDAFLDLLIEPSDKPSREQYGDPAADRLQSGSERFDADATSAALDADYPQSLQAQVLRAGLIARTYPVTAANDPIFVDSFFNSKVSETIDNPLVGSYVLSLVVNDGELDSELDTVSIRAFDGNAPPNALAGPDQSVQVGALVEVDGSASFDSDNGPTALSYRWRFTELPAGSLLEDGDISAANTANASFIADTAGDFGLELEVHDGGSGGLDTDTITIQVAATDVRPNADAGANQSLQECARVSVNAEGSFDSDAGPELLGFGWRFVSLPSGSALLSNDIENRNAIEASFTPDRLGSYVLEVRVSDGQFSDRDNVMIVVGSDPSQHGEACGP